MGATTAVAWAAPQVLATDRAGAAGLSACLTTYNFDTGNSQGWSISGSGQSRWQVSTLQSNTGSHSVWFGRNNTNGSVYPIVGQPHYRGNSRGSFLSPLSDASPFCDITFNIRLTIEDSPSYDQLDLNLVQGATRVKIWDKTQGGFTVVNHPSNPGSSWDLYTTNTAWVPITVNYGEPGRH